MSNADNPTERGDFWSSVPGLLTALATLVTAVFGGYLGYQQLNTDDPAPQSQSASASSPTPPSGDTYYMVFENPSALPAVAEEQFGSGDPVPACQQGDPDACQEVLDFLVEECGNEDMRLCDALYELTPVGSDYETYGATCGGFDRGQNAGRCELVYR